ncbi:MAG: ZIP family metal transporter [Candidatus Aenigmatarchaeota archaeon]
MLAASFTSLIFPALEISLYKTLIGIGLGFIFINFLNEVIPHKHFEKGYEGIKDSYYRKIRSSILFIVAITLHNMPEGMAVGVSFGSGNIENALSLTLAIGIQNIPEGLSVAIAALTAGFSTKAMAAYFGIRSGLVEIPLAVISALFVTAFQDLLPYAMGFAAGAMIFVITSEIVPEIYRKKKDEKYSSIGLMVGLILMIFLDNIIKA